MTASIEPSARLADIVNEHPDLARELDRRFLDYCCGGQRSLAEACAAAGLDPHQTANELPFGSSFNPATAPLLSSRRPSSTRPILHVVIRRVVDARSAFRSLR